MPVTVHQMIPVNSRGFFLRERDALNAQFGVELKFPKGRDFMHGRSDGNVDQTMLMVGSQRNIKSMMSQVHRIWDEAQVQYENFKVRQERRRDANYRNQNYRSKAVETITTTIKSKVNPFAALDELQKQEDKQHAEEMAARTESESIRLAKKESRKLEKQAIANGSAPKTMFRPTSTMNFAAMAAKPVAPKGTTSVKTSSASFATVSWGDMSDEEEW